MADTDMDGKPPLQSTPLNRQTAGIYMIRCANGKAYIGQSRVVLRRWTQHRWALNRGSHGNPHLQAAWTTLGERAFEFLLLRECGDPAERDILETQFINQYQTREREHGYNLIAVEEGKRGHSPETCAKISQGNKGKTVSPTTKLRMSRAQAGRHVSAATRARMSTAMQGKGAGVAKSAGHRAKIAVALQGRTLSAEHVSRVAAAKCGCPLTEEHRVQALAVLVRNHEARRGKPLSSVTKARISAANSGRVCSPEDRAKKSAALKGRPKTPEQIAAAITGKKAKQMKQVNHVHA